jgi:hypothetical protein
MNAARKTTLPRRGFNTFLFLFNHYIVFEDMKHLKRKQAPPPNQKSSSHHAITVFSMVFPPP